MLLLVGSTAVTLEDAKAAFDRGDFAAARRLCRDLEAAGDPDVKRQATELRKMMRSDALEAAIVAGCLAFFLWTVWKYFL